MPSAHERNQHTMTADDSIEAIMQTEFQQSRYQALHQITCRHEDGVLLLDGSVPSFHLKQVAFSMVRHKLANIQIEDRLRVSGS